MWPLKIWRRQQETLAGLSVATLSVTIGNGYCHIQPVAPGEEPRIAITITGEVADPSREAPFFQALQVRLDRTGDAITIREENRLPPGPERDSARVEVSVWLPGPAAVTVVLNNGDMAVAGLAQTSARGGTGQIRFSGRPLSGEHELSLQTGAVRLGLAQTSSVAYDLQVQTGAITTPDCAQAGAGPTRVRGTLGAGQAQLRVKVGVGSIQLNLIPGEPGPPATRS